MTSRTHDAFAFASLVTVAAFYPLPQVNLLTAICAVLACDIGALIPDMDQGGNRLWEMLPQGDKLGRGLRRIFWKHRTLTHSVVGVFGIYKFFEWILPKFLNPQFVNPEIILASIMIGIFSHLISDAFTEEGIPLLFPINYNFGFPPIRSWRIKTGQWFESWVVYPIIWIYVAWFVHSNEGIFLGILRSIRG
jgi:membrane-bound metal-dependent hydrolase YbcI (DUF457 family)